MLAADQPASILPSCAVRVGRDTLNWLDHRLPGLDLIWAFLDLIWAFLPAASSNVLVMLPTADVGGKRPVVAGVQT